MTYRWTQPTLFRWADCDPRPTLSDEEYADYCARYGESVMTAYYISEGAASGPASEPEPTPEDDEE